MAGVRCQVSGVRMSGDRGGVAPSVWDMAVFRKAYDLALEVHRIAQIFPKPEQYELASQLRRSSKSICANLAEGRARQRGSTAEFRPSYSLRSAAPTNPHCGAGSQEIWAISTT